MYLFYILLFYYLYYVLLFQHHVKCSAPGGFLQISGPPYCQKQKSNNFSQTICHLSRSSIRQVISISAVGPICFTNPHFPVLLCLFMFVQSVSGEIHSIACIVARTQHTLNESCIRIAIIIVDNEAIIQDHIKLGELINPTDTLLSRSEPSLSQFCSLGRARRCFKLDNLTG